ALVEGQVRFSIDVRGATHVVDLRCTVVVERRGGTGSGRWLLTHFHFSLPNGQQGEGDALMDALGRRNRELEEELARRTAWSERRLADCRQSQARIWDQETMVCRGWMPTGLAQETTTSHNSVNSFAALSSEIGGDRRQALADGDDAEAEALLGGLAV